MPILEILILRIFPHLDPSSPQILASLQLVRSLLAQRIHPTLSRFYQCVEDPGLIYVLGLWPTLESHKGFLESSSREEVLRPQEEVLEFVWCGHVKIGGEVGCEEIMKGKWLPLKAQVMAVARLGIKEGMEDEYQTAVNRYQGSVKGATEPHAPYHGWIVDPEQPEGKNIAVMISGWDTPENHKKFTANMRQSEPAYRAVRDTYEWMDVKHMKDMEG